jgi:hypothetical protein
MARILEVSLVLGLLVYGGYAGGSTPASATAAALVGGAPPAGPHDRWTQIVRQTLASIEPFHVVKLDTAAIAAAARAGRPVRLPFVTVQNRLVVADLRLTLHNLRAPTLTGADVKNGVSRSYRVLPLPPPATYQGRVEGKPGAAILTLDDRVVEGNILISPDGWSIIEPLEPQLRLHGLDERQRQEVLQHYDHIVYNVRNQHEPVKVDADLYPGAAHGAPRGAGPVHPAPAHSAPGAPTPAAAAPLVVTTVADGDDAFFRAYPPNSVMPYWLKEETLFNALDWLFNCIEPETDAANGYALCANNFDGGSNGFHARVQLDRLEAWEAGGPNSTDREVLLRQSARETHQAQPPCCGEPHTAGRSSLVFFFSGRTLRPGAGVASVAGLAVYGKSCFSDSDYLCHHGLTQVTPGGEFPGNAFFQELLVAHEVGHILGGAEQGMAFGVCWLFGTQCGTNLMGSMAFSGDPLYLFTPEDTHSVMGPLLRERLGGGQAPAKRAVPVHP